MELCSLCFLLFEYLRSAIGAGWHSRRPVVELNRKRMGDRIVFWRVAFRIRV